MESPLAAVSSKVISTTSMPWRQAHWRGTRPTNRSDAAASEDEFTQLLLDQVQLARAVWSPGVLQRGSAPKGTWAFGLPLVAEGSLHVRRRPAAPGELIAATSRDDVGFAATGPTDLMIVALPTSLIDRWVQTRRGIDRFDLDLPSPRWQVPADEMARRARTLSSLLETLTTELSICWPTRCCPGSNLGFST